MSPPPGRRARSPPRRPAWASRAWTRTPARTRRPGPPGPRISTSLSYALPSLVSFISSCLFLLVVVHNLVVGVDHVVLLLGRGLRWAGSGRRLGAGSSGAALRGVERRAGRGVCLLQLIQRPGDLVRVARTEGLLRPLHRLVEACLERCVELLDPLFGVLLHLVHHRVEPVTALDLLTAPLVFRGVGLRILDHLVDVFVTQPRGRLDPDLLLLARRLSLAETCRMPFASMSNVTSICGTPRGAGGIPVSWNLPMVRLSTAIWRSPWSTWISTVVCVSSAVEKISDFLVGIVVFRGMSTVVTPPSVSMPSDSGVTSSSSTSFTSPASTPP